jgi:hypothetical protein
MLKRTRVINSAWAARQVGERAAPRVVLRKKLSVEHPTTLVDRPSTHSLTNPRGTAGWRACALPSRTGPFRKSRLKPR